MSEFIPSVEPQTSPTGNPDPQARQIMFDRFVRASAWFALHVLLLVGYLTCVFAVGMNWLTALAIFFVAGLALGRIAGLSRAWLFAMIAQAVIVLGAGLIASVFNALL